MDEPFMRNMPDALPEDAEDELKDKFKKFKYELLNMQASRQAMYDDFGMVVPLQEVGNTYRLPLLIDYILGVDTEQRIQFERMWVKFLQNQMDEQRVIANRQMQAKTLHIPGRGAHQVLPEEEVKPDDNPNP